MVSISLGPILILRQRLIVILLQRPSPNRLMVALSYPPNVQLSTPLPHCPIRIRHILTFGGDDALQPVFLYTTHLTNIALGNLEAAVA